MENVLWSDKKIFTIAKINNHQNIQQLLTPMQRNDRKTKIITQSLFYEKNNDLDKSYCHGKNSLTFIDKNMMINEKKRTKTKCL